MADVLVDPRIVEEWTRRATDGVLGLDMVLSSDSPAAESIASLRDVVDTLAAAHQQIIDATHPAPGDEPPWPGQWHAVELADGRVGISVSDCDRADVFVSRVAAALEQRGIGGRLSFYEWPSAPDPPASALVVECRLLVRGTRSNPRGRIYRWRPDPAALERLIHLGAGWLRRGDELSTPVLTLGAAPPVALGLGEDVAGRVLPDVDSPGDIEVRVAARTGFRTMVWSKNHKQLALIHAIGDHLGDGDWAVPVNDLTQTLLSSAEVCAYGYIKRGTSQARARNGYALAEEWPEREGHTSHEIRVPTTTAFYDEYAPDAFGSQLLGPGYAGRVPPAPSYSQRPVADTVMLEHEDLAAWYEHPFVPATFDSRNIAQAPVPPVLANARAELAPILFRPDVIPGA